MILTFSESNPQTQFMVELDHTPETCVASGKDDVVSNAKLLINLREISQQHGVKLVGGWAFPIGHKLWYVVEASDSHAVAELFYALGAHRWNTLTINPVLGHDKFSEDVLKGLTIKGEPAEIPFTLEER